VFNAIFKNFQLCHGGQFYWWRKPRTCRKSLTTLSRFNFPIVNFPFICSNIQQNLHMKNIYLSSDPKFQTFGSYQDVLERGLLLTKKLLNQWFILVKLKSYGRHHNLVNCYGLCVSNVHGYVKFTMGKLNLLS
jgi:hypothetical protein